MNDARLRVYLYHIPPIAQVGFSLDLIEQLTGEFPETIVGLKDSSGDWANMQAIRQRFPNLELFPGSEAFLLDGLKAGAVGTISAGANINGAMMRKLFETWQEPEADQLQNRISAVRTALQDHPLIPVLKSLIAHYRSDQTWAALRAPNMALPPAVGRTLAKQLADDHGFTPDFPN